MSEIQNSTPLDAQDNSSYEEVIYDKLPHKQGNLRFLETVADLYGVNPVDISGCRVLELGTATGKTIIPQAEEFPNSRFLGIDLSPTQIDAGKEFLRSLHLSNIELRTADILEVDASWGEFDYIITHGVYSWVPPFVQEKMLEICQTNLSPRGVAMISYNTYPGWHFKECARNLMLLHSKRANVFSDAKTEIQQARAILNYTAEIVSKQKSSYFSQFLEGMQEHIKGIDDHYLFHEYLETENSPCYFLEFCRRLQEKGLQHIADFDWTNYQTWQKDPQLKALIDSTQNNVISEQYIDFIINRTFRSSVICRGEIELGLRDDLVERYHFFIPNDCVIQRTEPKDGAAPAWLFSRKTQMEVSLPSGPLVDSVCAYMNANRDKYMTAQSLWDAVASSLSPKLLSGEVNRNDLVRILDQLIRLEVLRILLHPPVERQPDPRRPYTRTFTRQMLKRHAKAVPNSVFEILTIDPLSETLLKQFDGRHAITEIVSEIQKEMQNNRLNIAKHGVEIRSDQRDKITEIVEEAIGNLQKCRLVV